jgi:hypothetical protein
MRVFLDLLLPYEGSDVANVGVVEDSWVNFGFPSEGGRSLASPILATTGRWSDLALPVNKVGGAVMLCHLHSESKA